MAVPIPISKGKQKKISLLKKKHERDIIHENTFSHALLHKLSTSGRKNNEKTLTVTGTGDALFVAPFPDAYDNELQKIAEYIQSCDVRLTNLETNLSDFEYFGNAYSGGTWINTKRDYIAYLKKYGFDFYGNANNHAMDYGHNGLLSTVRALDDNGLCHAGTGKSLADASKPAVFVKNGQKIAVFAVDASMESASKAGNATNDIIARPGVNFLRHDTYYHVTEEQMAQLKAIADATRINFTRNFNINTGFGTPDPAGQFAFGDTVFVTDHTKPVSECNKKDLARILADIEKAKAENDYVFVLVHCHDNDGTAVTNPPAYLRQFCHACIDSGVSAVFGGGCHQLRGIEIYKNCPVFYSLGDFIYQGLRVEYLPADFMEKYGTDIYASAEKALFDRSRNNTVGLHLMKENYQTVLPKIEFENGVMTRLELQPVYLNFDAEDHRNGLPAIAEGEEAEQIISIVKTLSAQYGTTFSIEDTKMVLSTR